MLARARPRSLLMRAPLIRNRTTSFICEGARDSGLGHETRAVQCCSSRGAQVPRQQGHAPYGAPALSFVTLCTHRAPHPVLVPAILLGREHILKAVRGSAAARRETPSAPIFAGNKAMLTFAATRVTRQPKAAGIT